MGNGTSARLGKTPAKSGAETNTAAQRLARQEAELQRRRLLALESAREAERRRNGLGATPVRPEKPASPAGATPLNPRRKRPAKVKDARGRTSSVPRTSSGDQRRVRTPVKVAPAYMLLSPADLKRDRQRRQAQAKRDAERPAKKAEQAAEKPGKSRRRAT